MRILHPWFSAASAGALAFAAEITDCPAHANNLKIISGGVADDEAPFSLGGTIPSKSSSLLSSKSSSSSSCRVPVFDGPRLHEALEGQWLYMAGDSSTRGLALALYYSLLDAAATLASPWRTLTSGRVRSSPLPVHGASSSTAPKGTPSHQPAGAGWLYEVGFTEAIE